MNKLRRVILIILMLLFVNILSAYDNTQIIASNYCEAPKATFYEVALPHPKGKKNWVKIYYKNKIAIVKVNDIGPQNEYDNYWETGIDASGYRNRWMFQNLEQWMPAAEWVLSSAQGGVSSNRQIIEHPDFLGKSDFYTEATGNEFYPDFTKGKRYVVGDLAVNSDPHIISNIEDKKFWKSYTTNAGIDLSGGVWKHLNKSSWNNPNIRDVVEWEFYDVEPPKPEIKNILPAPNSYITDTQPTISADIDDIYCGMDIGIEQLNKKKSIASVKMFLSPNPGQTPIEVPIIWKVRDDNVGVGIDKIKIEYKPTAKLQQGQYTIKIIAKNNAGIETELVYNFTIGMIPFLSNFTPGQYQYVRIANPQQTPTPVPVEGTTPTYPSAYSTATVQVDGFIKGLMLGMTGGADFSDSKYKEGYKAIGIAAYT